MKTSSQSFVKKTRWKWKTAMMEMKMNNKKKLPSDQRRVRSVPGGGTPIHYLYGYVPPNGVVILKLLV